MRCVGQKEREAGGRRQAGRAAPKRACKHIPPEERRRLPDHGAELSSGGTSLLLPSRRNTARRNATGQARRIADSH